jgi:hypothetical protein
MEKPFDLKALGAAIVAEAKKDGLHLAEETAESLAKAAYFGVKGWLEASAKLTVTPIDDVVVGFISKADPFVMEQIEKLDLDKDGK